jgi:hypothetical protein
LALEICGFYRTHFARRSFSADGDYHDGQDLPDLIERTYNAVILSLSNG